MELTMPAILPMPWASISLMMSGLGVPGRNPALTSSSDMRPEKRMFVPLPRTFGLRTVRATPAAPLRMASAIHVLCSNR